MGHNQQCQEYLEDHYLLTKKLMSTSISDLLYWCALENHADDETERDVIQTAGANARRIAALDNNKHMLKVFVNGKEIEDPTDQTLSKRKFFDKILQRGFLDYPAIWLPTQHHSCIPLTHPPTGKRYIAFWALTQNQLKLLTQIAGFEGITKHIQHKIALGTMNSGLTSTNQIPRLTLFSLFDSKVLKVKSSEHIKKLHDKMRLAQTKWYVDTPRHDGQLNDFQKAQISISNLQDTIQKQIANRENHKKEIDMRICFSCLDTSFNLLPSPEKIRFDHLIEVEQAILLCVASTGRYNYMYLDCRTSSFNLPESDKDIPYNRVMSTILKDMATEINQSALISYPNELNLCQRSGEKANLGQFVNFARRAFLEYPEVLFYNNNEDETFECGCVQVSTLSNILLFILQANQHKT